MNSLSLQLLLIRINSRHLVENLDLTKLFVCLFETTRLFSPTVTLMVFMLLMIQISSARRIKKKILGNSARPISEVFTPKLFLRAD